ncbi:CDP-alcohol phosphatidyltransferase family protein [Sphingomonas sp. LY54]|uniref:CDP-alcohol phosphatidyltransferase family protein n=1 Tax=Sphingomonas sp. LY54 TaxID=3095343 RepID=UPI002D764D8E|nr:CDP-alcohol phosphatidyltransferase family protein [Sphingomonas sp. LY54]WRP27789.1 CDP-alcohol phosphatidyltransferase family protein [Sphingomonas sp. LY54]
MTTIAGVGANETKLWGLTAAERLGRIVRAQGLTPVDHADAVVLANLAYVWDPTWLRFVAARPDHVVTFGGVPVLAHCAEAGDRARVREAMAANRPLDAAGGLTIVAQEHSEGLTNDELRKRERPFMDRLVPETVRSLERASYFGAYKGVTDVLTKYLWPEWALVLTRIAARFGITPNMVTAVGAALCVAATFLFYYGWFWTGLAAGLVFMVLDTVDGKLARCTITSSWWGNVFDHGIDLVHPPFWWYAWGIGLHAYGRPLSDELFYAVMAVIVGGYVLQRLIEGAFIKQFGMHIHVWEHFDSWFRLITARRNPNMVILLVGLVVGRPDWGLVAVAGWTLISLVVHFVRLMQAWSVRAQGRPIISWLG